jgi:hypothetical protein
MTPWVCGAGYATPATTRCAPSQQVRGSLSSAGIRRHMNLRLVEEHRMRRGAAQLVDARRGTFEAKSGGRRDQATVVEHVARTNSSSSGRRQIVTAAACAIVRPRMCSPRRGACGPASSARTRQTAGAGPSREPARRHAHPAVVISCPPGLSCGENSPSAMCASLSRSSRTAACDLRHVRHQRSDLRVNERHDAS